MSKPNEHDLDTPAGYVQNGPGDALELPTKHYPNSGSLAKEPPKSSSVIEGPCSPQGELRGYHK